MAVPANWQGTPDHFYHFFLGYFMPLVLWQEKTGVAEVAVRDCGPMNAWFDLLRPGTDVDYMPSGVMLERVLSHRQERVILHDWDNPTRFHRRALRQFTQAVLPRAVEGSSPVLPAHHGGCRITLLERRPNPEYYHSDHAETPGGGSQWRSVPNVADIADALAPLGIVDIVDTATLSPRDQIRTLRDTDLLVAQHGAGLANMVWLPGRAGVVELLPPRPPTIDAIFSNLAAACELAYVVVPQEDEHSAVDPQAVASAATALLADPDACIPTATGSLPMRLLRQLPRRL